MVKSKRVTLKDISRAVNLSVSTVSKVLNGKETFCSEAKVQEIRDTAARLGYCRNMGYNIMTGGKTNIVAIIFSQKYITHNHHINLLYMHLCSMLRQRGFASYTSVLDVNMGADEQLAQIKELDDLGCRYYIFIGYPTEYLILQEFVQSRARNFICMNNEASPRSVNTDIPGAYLKYIRDFHTGGISNFRIFSSDDFLYHDLLPLIPAKLREYAMRSFVVVDRKKFLSEEPDLEFFQQGYELIKNEFSGDSGIQGVIFPSDFNVFGAAKYLQEQQISGVKLCGMNCSIAAQYAFTPIITTRFDMKKCAVLLLDNMAGTDDIKILLPGEIVNFG